MQIETDGRTVWVNGVNGAIGRFGVFGIDVHNATNDGCLACSVRRLATTLADWQLFKTEMLAQHGIDVSDKWIPKRLRTSSLTRR